MKHKSITFRCAAPQLERMGHLLQAGGQNRSCCLSEALTSFLAFADSQDAAQLDLFALVNRVNGMGGPLFHEQA